MNTENEEIVLYQYYLNLAINRRNEAIELLNKRDFISMERNYIHWFDKKEKNVALESTAIRDVVRELSRIRIEDNETEPFLSCCVTQNESMFGGDTESSLEITSYVYTIVPFEKCERHANNNTRSALWKLKYQPNGKDAAHYREILNRT